MPQIETGSPEAQNSARFANASRRFKTGVEVPTDERKWAGHLVESFKRLDSGYQQRITQIIEGLRKEKPERALEIARQIGEFFNNVGSARDRFTDLPTFLENLENQLKSEKTERIN